jgi:hypothetical protein
MRILQNWTPWTDPAGRFSRSGASNLKNMSPKIRLVKIFTGKDGLRPDYRIEKIFYLLVPDSLLLPLDFHSVFPPVS